MKKVALVKDRNRFWEIYENILKNYGVEVQLVDIFSQRDQTNLLSNSFDAFIWRAKHTPHIRDLARRWLYFFDIECGIRTFPSWRAFWHYDDKIAQYYLLKKHSVSTPDTFLFFNKEEALEFARHCEYPMVYKCAHGAGSANVGLLRTKKEAVKYIKRVFDRGMNTYFKSEIQRNYVYFQEFLAGNKGDYRMVCFGDNRISGFFRENRAESPFASGSGQFDIGELPKNLLDFAANTHKRLNYALMSYDILKDSKTYVVTEMSVIYGDLTHDVYDKALIYERNPNDEWSNFPTPESRHERFIKFLLREWNWDV